MRTRPWHGDLIARVFQAGPAVPLEKVALGLGQSERACRRVLDSPWGQAELARYHAARRQVLATKGVKPLEELGTWAHEAARGLVAAMWLAAEAGNARELRDSSAAILNFLGYAPAKRVEKKVLHQVETIQDVTVLNELSERLRNGEDVELEALPAPAQQ